MPPVVVASVMRFRAGTTRVKWGGVVTTILMLGGPDPFTCLANGICPPGGDPLPAGTRPLLWLAVGLVALGVVRWWRGRGRGEDG